MAEVEHKNRLLNEKIELLMVEIRSGAPNERRIFEIAKSQAQREHLHSVKLDTRELAFQQLQDKLSLKDLQLAQLQTANSGLQAEVAQLSRVAKRNLPVLADFGTTATGQGEGSPSIMTLHRLNSHVARDLTRPKVPRLGLKVTVASKAITKKIVTQTHWRQENCWFHKSHRSLSAPRE